MAPGCYAVNAHVAERQRLARLAAFRCPGRPHEIGVWRRVVARAEDFRRHGARIDVHGGLAVGGDGAPISRPAVLYQPSQQRDGAPDAIALPQVLIRDDPAQRRQRKEIAVSVTSESYGSASAIAAVGSRAP